MAKLDDYGSNFQPGLKLDNFSPDALIRMLNLYCRFYGAVDGLWYLSLKEKLGNNEALDRDIWVWERMARYEMKHITSEFNIRGSDISALARALQLTPWFWQTEANVTVESPRSATYTATRCRVLEYMEKEGEGRENQICRRVEPRVLAAYASFFNSSIKVECLEAPPREDGNGVCCRWRFVLEDY